MPRIAYISKRFNESSLVLIALANKIIEEYDELGFALTLRQLFYQFVSRDYLPNKQKEYKRLGGIISDARLAGLIDWNAIEDRTRNLRAPATWESPEDIVNACAKQFNFDCWEDQPHRVEVWIEKDALLGVIEPVCSRLEVPFFSCRGYTSQSELWTAGRRARERAVHQSTVILHLGDHDPSGIDMTRDIEARISMFAEMPVRVIRIALNYEQVEEFSPPPNPAKWTDSRAVKYVEEYGEESWELDALDPREIDRLIDVNVRRWRDDRLWAAMMERRDEARETLAKVAERWEDVQDFVS